MEFPLLSPHVLGKRKGDLLTLIIGLFFKNLYLDRGVPERMLQHQGQKPCLWSSYFLQQGV